MSTPTTDRPVCFLDTETDGLHHQCRAWEIAVIRRDTDGTECTHEWFLPLDLRHANPQALHVGRFWDRHPAGRKVSGKPEVPCRPTTPVHDVARDLMKVTFGATLVGASPHFDADVIARLLRNEGYMPSWHYRLRDVGSLASGLVGYDVGGLDGALEALDLPGVPEQARHTAYGDAAAARDIYGAVFAPRPSEPEPDKQIHLTRPPRQATGYRLGGVGR